MSDWDKSEEEAKPVPKPVIRKKWEGEDEDDEVASDWDESSEEENAPVSNAAPPRKKGTLKQKLAEKEAIRQQRLLNGEDESEEEFLDEREKRLRDRERELQADLTNASDLLGSTSISAGTTGSAALDSLIAQNPRTKEEFEEYSQKVYLMLIKPHINKPLFSGFAEHHVRAICDSLRDVEIRKAATSLTSLANVKQQEQRDKASGKKKTKLAKVETKASARIDTTAYNDALDDFGNDDFM